MESFAAVVGIFCAFLALSWWHTRASSGGRRRVRLKPTPRSSPGDGWDKAVFTVARAHNLSATAPSKTTLRSAIGSIDGLPVAIFAGRVRDGRIQRLVTRLEVDVGLPASLGIKAEVPVDSLGLVSTGNDTKVGSADFDELAHLRGLSSYALTAICSGAARRALTQWLEAGGSIANGCLHFPLKSTGDPATIEAAIGRARKLAPLLTAMPVGDADWVAERLREAALSDPEPSFRVHAATELFAAYPRSRLARQTATELLAADLPMLRARAASFSEAKGAVDVAHAVAIDDAAPLQARIAALDVLTTRFKDQLQTHSALTALIGKGRTTLAAVALTAAADIRPLPLDVLVPLLDVHHLVKPAVSEILRHNQAAQVPLIAGLSRELNDDGLLTIVTALGTCGDTGAVAPLQALKGTRQLRQAVTASIASIQSRAIGASEGQLTVSAAADGKLSL